MGIASIVRYAALSGLIFSSPCIARNWVFSGTSTDGASSSYDSSSAVVVGPIVTVWVKYDYSNTKSETARSAMARIEFNCSTQYTRGLDFIRYSATGNALSTSHTPFAEAQPIIPDSLGDHMAGLLCNALAK